MLKALIFIIFWILSIFLNRLFFQQSITLRFSPEQFLSKLSTYITSYLYQQIDFPCHWCLVLYSYMQGFSNSSYSDFSILYLLSFPVHSLPHWKLNMEEYGINNVINRKIKEGGGMERIMEKTEYSKDRFSEVRKPRMRRDLWGQVMESLLPEESICLRLCSRRQSWWRRQGSESLVQHSWLQSVAHRCTTALLSFLCVFALKTPNFI